MRPSLRALAIITFGWAGVRAATLGVIPGPELIRIDRNEAKPPPVVPTEFPDIQPISSAPTDIAAQVFREAAMPSPAGSPAPAASRVMFLPVYGPARSAVPNSGPTPLANVMPEPRTLFYSPLPALDEWPLSRIAGTSVASLRSSVVTPGQSLPVALKRNGIDRLQLTAWTLLRAQSGGIAGSQSLASSGSLGASQAGARLAYNFTRQVAATLRMSSEVGRRGGEIAAGVRVQPLTGIPVWITGERRQRVGTLGGRNAFALFFEAGVWDRPMPLHLLLDTYLEGGLVGIHSRDRFIDGALTLTRPVYKQFSAGLGVWGGAQPGLYRVDAGPRVTMRVRNNVRVHFDWRQRLAGNAMPGSGPAVTLAGDF